MDIRRSVAGLLTALALVSGGALTACGDTTDSTTGTPKDHAKNTSGSDPGGVSQGNLPNVSDPDHSSGRDQGESNNQ
jgi:ABC-type oligopeptide transport system substrate-binding subunit